MRKLSKKQKTLLIKWFCDHDNPYIDTMNCDHHWDIYCLNPFENFDSVATRFLIDIRNDIAFTSFDMEDFKKEND